MSFNFLQKWLLFVSAYLVLFGMVLAFFNQSALMDMIFNNQIDPVFWQEDDIPAGVVSFQSFIYGVLGATVSGWGLCMAFLVAHPFKARERWAWNCLAASMAVWFVADTALSALHHVTFNVLFNAVLLLLIGLPLAFTRKYFFRAA